MKTFKGILLATGAVALIGAGCEASVGGADGGDSTVAGDTDATTGVDTTADTAADAVAKKKYKYVTLDGQIVKKDDCDKTSSPGSDIDSVVVYRGAQIIGVGSKAVFKAGLSPLCPGKSKGEVKDVEGPVNGKSYDGKCEPATNKNCDTGYFSLSNGSIEMQIGGCTASTTKVTDCDGSGAAVEIEQGDEIDVYEVDETYKAGSGQPQAGFAEPKCTCLAEEYEVYVSAKAGSVGAPDGISLGTFKGTKGHIVVK